MTEVKPGVPLTTLLSGPPSAEVYELAATRIVATPGVYGQDRSDNILQILEGKQSAVDALRETDPKTYEAFHDLYLAVQKLAGRHGRPYGNSKPDHVMEIMAGGTHEE